MESKPKQEDILNAILPPREWVEQGKHTGDLKNSCEFELLFCSSNYVTDISWLLGKHYIQYVSH